MKYTTLSCFVNLNQVKTFSLTHLLLAIPLSLPDYLALFKCPYLRTSFVFGATIGFPNFLLVSVLLPLSRVIAVLLVRPYFLGHHYTINHLSILCSLSVIFTVSANFCPFWYKKNWQPSIPGIRIPGIRAQNPCHKSNSRGKISNLIKTLT